jgi:quercetin dioxygenase-like cupin family protein
VLVDTATITAETGTPEVSGAVWKLQARERDLDSNIIALPPGGVIDTHAGPDLDVLIHVLAGSGELTTELGTIALTPHALLWMPRRSQRRFTAGEHGLRYLTVHQRRQALVLQTSAP